MTTRSPFRAIDRALLLVVAGGAARVTARSGGADEQTIKMLTQVTDSIKDLAKNQSSGSDPMQMMMLMMMMGGMGGGGASGAPAAAAAPPPPPAKPVVSISSSISR
jgi:hypothetical protein